MRYTKLVAALMAGLVVLTGAAAAMPGNAPDDVPATDDESDANGTDTEPDADAGPPADLPGPVPDFVGTLLDKIGAFLDGDLEGPLGPTISDVTPGPDATPNGG